MELQIDHYEKDLLTDCIQHRLDTDKILIINDSLKSEIADLLGTCVLHTWIIVWVILTPF